MAMSTGAKDADGPMSDINTTPLVDIMLVLLIIFLLTVPVVIQTIDLTLPKVQFEVTTTKPENVSLQVRGSGQSCEVYWGMTQVTHGELLERAQKKLEADIARVGGIENVTAENMPEVHIRGDVNTPYRCIGGAIFTMQMAGFVKVGFISEPEPGATVIKRL